MNTLICPTCGCSLVRLEISRDKAVAHTYSGGEYLFCCQGCVDIFVTNPKKYLDEISDLIVCPTCLREKPMQFSAKIEFEGKDVYYCRCPHCVDEFKKKPEYFIKRLAGTAD